MIPRFYTIDSALAMEIGIERATIAQRVIDWVRWKFGRGEDIRGGQAWFRHSVAAWALEFPMLSERTVRRHLDWLVSRGLILARHEKGSLDRKLWYSVDGATLEAYRERGRAKLGASVPAWHDNGVELEDEKPREVPCGQIGQMQSDSLSDESDKLATCKVTNCQFPHSLEQIHEDRSTQGDRAGARGTPPGKDKGKEGGEVEALAWEAYEIAYEARYGESPKRAPGDTEALRRLSSMPRDLAPFVVALFVAHPRVYYAERGHELAVCAQDARKLETELKTRRIFDNTRKSGRRFDHGVYDAVAQWWRKRENIEQSEP